MRTLRRVIFLALEALILAFPATLIVNAAFQWHGATADAITETMLPPSIVGFFGMILWTVRYMREEVAYSRFGLASMLAVIVFLWGALPSVAE